MQNEQLAEALGERTCAPPKETFVDLLADRAGEVAVRLTNIERLVREAIGDGGGETVGHMGTQGSVEGGKRDLSREAWLLRVRSAVPFLGEVAARLATLEKQLREIFS